MTRTLGSLFWVAAWRIIPGLGYVVRITPIYKPTKRPFGRGPTTLLGGLTNHGP